MSSYAPTSFEYCHEDLEEVLNQDSEFPFEHGLDKWLRRYNAEDRGRAIRLELARLRQRDQTLQQLQRRHDYFTQEGIGQ